MELGLGPGDFVLHGDPVWGTPANFNGFRVLAALLYGTLIVGVSQTAVLNRGRHLCSTGRPSRLALAHILVVIEITSNVAFLTNRLPFLFRICIYNQVLLAVSTQQKTHSTNFQILYTLVLTISTGVARLPTLARIPPPVTLRTALRPANSIGGGRSFKVEWQQLGSGTMLPVVSRGKASGRGDAAEANDTFVKMCCFKRN